MSTKPALGFEAARFCAHNRVHDGLHRQKFLLMVTQVPETFPIGRKSAEGGLFVFKRTCVICVSAAINTPKDTGAALMCAQ